MLFNPNTHIFTVIDGTDFAHEGRIVFAGSNYRHGLDRAVHEASALNARHDDYQLGEGTRGARIRHEHWRGETFLSAEEGVVVDGDFEPVPEYVQTPVLHECVGVETE